MRQTSPRSIGRSQSALLLPIAERNSGAIALYAGNLDVSVEIGIEGTD
jgi:hypothetical protein